MTKNSLTTAVSHAIACGRRRGCAAGGDAPDTTIPTQLRIQLQLPNSNWVPTVRAPRTALCGGVGPSGRRIAMCVKARRGEGAGSIAGCRAERAEVVAPRT